MNNSVVLMFWLRTCFHIPQTASLAPSPNRRGPHHRLSWIQPDKAAVALGELNNCCGHHYMRHHGKCAKGNHIQEFKNINMLNNMNTLLNLAHSAPNTPFGYVDLKRTTSSR